VLLGVTGGIAAYKACILVRLLRLRGASVRGVMTRAAGRVGTIMVVSTTALDRLEQVAAASTFPKWWQLYVFTDRDFTAEMLCRVHVAG